MAALRAVLISIVVLAALVAVPIARLAPRLSTAVIQRACRMLLVLMGVRLRIEGAPARGLLVANHVSWLDAMLVTSLQPLCFLAKSEIGAWPVIASIARSQGTIFVDRRRPRGIPAVNEAMAERLATGRAVLLFPEGTTHDGSRCGRFHTSHLACIRSLFARAPATLRAEVQPVALAYSDPVAAWIGDDTLLPHLWRILRRPGITCTLKFGTTIALERGYDRKALGRALLGEVEALLSRQPLPGPDIVAAPDEDAAPLAEQHDRSRPRPRQARVLGYAANRSSFSAEPSLARGQDVGVKSP